MKNIDLHLFFDSKVEGWRVRITGLPTAPHWYTPPTMSIHEALRMAAQWIVLELRAQQQAPQEELAPP